MTLSAYVDEDDVEPFVLGASMPTPCSQTTHLQNIIAIIWDFDKTLSPQDQHCRICRHVFSPCKAYIAHEQFA